MARSDGSAPHTPHHSKKFINSKSLIKDSTKIIYAYVVLAVTTNCTSSKTENLFFWFVPCFASILVSTNAAFDFHISLVFFLPYTCFNRIPKPTGLVSWSQICLLNSMAAFETVRSYQFLKKVADTTKLGSEYDLKHVAKRVSSTVSKRVLAGLFPHRWRRIHMQWCSSTH